MEEQNTIIIRTKLQDESIHIQTLPNLSATFLADHAKVTQMVTNIRKILNGTAVDYFVVNSKKYTDA